jgi:hypothetical protein
LEFVGLTEEEFVQIAMSHAVSPHEHEPATTTTGKRTHDFETWCRHGSMPRGETLVQLQRWNRRRPASVLRKSTAVTNEVE